MSSQRILLVSVALIAFFLAIGAALGLYGYLTRQEPPRREVVVFAPQVDVLIIEPQEIAETFDGYGTARAMREAKVAAQISATVVERSEHVRPGAVIKQHDVLVRLDEREFRHELERVTAEATAQRASLAELEAEAASLEALIETAEVELRVAAAERDRVAALFERDHAAKREFDVAHLAYQQARRTLQSYRREAALLAPRKARIEAQLTGLEAEAARSRLNIERCTIRAPFSGQLVSVEVDVGHAVAPGTVVASLMDTSRVEVEIQLPASAYYAIAVGAPCRLTTEKSRRGTTGSIPRGYAQVTTGGTAHTSSSPNRSTSSTWDSQTGDGISHPTDVAWKSPVARIAPMIERQTRTFPIYAVVDNRDSTHPLVPGTFVRASVQGPFYEDGILIPRSAYRFGRVFVAENGVARARPVAVERLLKDLALVREGLREGEAVILNPSDQLADGSAVRVRSTHRIENGSVALMPQPSPESASEQRRESLNHPSPERAIETDQPRSGGNSKDRP